MHTGPGKLTSTRTHLMRTTVRMQYFGCIDRAQCAWIESAKTRATATFYDRACARPVMRALFYAHARMHMHACMAWPSTCVRARPMHFFQSIKVDARAYFVRLVLHIGISVRSTSIHAHACIRPSIRSTRVHAYIIIYGSTRTYRAHVRKYASYASIASTNATTYTYVCTCARS